MKLDEFFFQFLVLIICLAEFHVVLEQVRFNFFLFHQVRPPGGKNSTTPPLFQFTALFFIIPILVSSHTGMHLLLPCQALSQSP
jgi:hypothetical protein